MEENRLRPEFFPGEGSDLLFPARRAIQFAILDCDNTRALRGCTRVNHNNADWVARSELHQLAIITMKCQRITGPRVLDFLKV